MKIISKTLQMLSNRGQRVLTFGATRPHLGAMRPRVGIAKLGLESPTWQ